MVSIKHKKVLTIPDDPDAVAAGMVASSDWNNVLDFRTAAALIFLGRKTASAGDVEELTASDARTLLGLVPGTAAGQIPVLDGSGKLDTSILPSLAITETFVVNSQSAMLALTAQTGDVAIRTDLNKTFILSTNNPGTLADWKEMLTPTDLVLSVAGLTGAISASALKAALAIAVADITDMSAAGRLFVALSSYANMFNAIKQAATDTATGVVELATNAEAIAGTDTTRAVTPAGLAAAIAAAGGGSMTVITGYVKTSGLTAGSGEEAFSYDVTIAPQTVGKVMPFFVGGSSPGANAGDREFSATGTAIMKVIPKLISSTTLRLCVPSAAASTDTISGRYYLWVSP